MGWGESIYTYILHPGTSQTTRPNCARIGDGWEVGTADMAQDANSSTQRTMGIWNSTQIPGTLPGSRRHIVNMCRRYMLKKPSTHSTSTRSTGRSGNGTPSIQKDSTTTTSMASPQNWPISTLLTYMKSAKIQKSWIETGRGNHSKANFAAIRSNFLTIPPDVSFVPVAGNDGILCLTVL
ncbi:Protein CBG12283 [Caenorhabditis briggsae]|uniref:Protein CBG12283 n=1 Tax=Caenorhabditis briggsae TaxID=6238 RepID=A8XF63_CAEBR|nr:Protein CBG12283 [Caenorhabditis briggsae]CAP31285.1 Protein CBG12283 [Caenorhabditis briggsae]